MELNFLSKKFKPMIVHLPNIDDVIECDNIIKNNEEINSDNYYLLPEPLYANEKLVYKTIILKGEIISKHKLDIGLNLYKLVKPKICGPGSRTDGITKNIFSVNENKYLIPYKLLLNYFLNGNIILGGFVPLGVSAPVSKKESKIKIIDIKYLNAFIELKNQNKLELEENYKVLEYEEYDILAKNKKYVFKK